MSCSNIFDCGGLNSKGHVTYCLDISGSMYLCLDTIKTHLIEHLRSKATLEDETRVANLFNLIAFSSEIYPWSNAVTLCNKSSVASAIDWIERLECKTGTNTLDALVKAFEDEQTTSICLLTDDICDQQPYVLLNRVSQISRGRPVHCIYLSSNRSDTSEQPTIEYLHSLASITRGSFRIVTIGRRGIVEKITPIITQDMASTLQLANLSLHAMNSSTSSSSSILSVAQIATPSVVLATSKSMPTYVWNDANRVSVGRVVQPSINQPRSTNDIAFSPEAGLMLVNRRVLARSKLDGYFYKGKVISQILAHRFTVEFDQKKASKDSYKTSDYQDTAIYDIIHFDDAIQHPIRVGDKVLALFDADSERYAPGEVLEGFAKRSSKDSNDTANCTNGLKIFINKARADVTLIVRFSNGKTRTLTEQESPAIWLPDPAYNRLKFELNLPSNARHYVEALNTDYPLTSLPGYPAQPVKPFALPMPRLAYATWPFYVPYNPAYSVTTLPTTVIGQKETNTTREARINEANVDANKVSREVVITNGHEITTSDLNRKIKEQIKINEHLLNELEEKKCRARSKSLERSCCHQHQHQHQHQIPVEAYVKHVCTSDVKEVLDQNQYSNKYYEAYRQQIHDLYHDCHYQNQNYCCHSRAHSPAESLVRSKSVSFCDSHHNSDYESDHDDGSLCSHHSKESTASKSKHKKLVYTNVPNRFGNPKVSVGLPDRPISAHANLGIKSKSISDLGPATTKIRTNHQAERWEKAHKEHIETQAKKAAARDEYKRVQMQNRTAEMEKHEPPKPYHINRPKKTPTESWEAKEEKKIAYMRSQAAKRDMENMALLREQALKEANKLAYKKSQETKRNQVYHERLMAEEAWRQGEQRQSQLKYERAKLNQEAKENRERQRDELDKSLRHDKYIKMKNNIFY